MTDDNGSRRIGGLEPRTTAPDLSRLIRRNRPESGEMPSSTPALKDDVSGALIGGDAPEPSSPTDVSQTKPMPAPSSAPATANTAVDSQTKRMTVYLTSRHYARARAAYRATSYAAQDRSWSDFVEKALVAEFERREAEFNAGEPYAPDSSPLSPGRPLSS